MNSPRIGIAICSYKKYGYLPETLRSALSHRYSPKKIDLLVVEDGAKNRSQILEAFQNTLRHSRISEGISSCHLIISDRNCGTPKARNIGMDILSESGSALLAHLDGDDLLHPDFALALSAEIAKHENQKGIVSYSHTYGFRDGAGLTLSKILQGTYREYVKPYGRRDLYCSVWMMPKEVYEMVGGYHEWMKERWEDAEFVDALSLMGITTYAAGTYYFYRVGTTLHDRDEISTKNAALLWAKRLLINRSAPELSGIREDEALMKTLEAEGLQKTRRCAGKVGLELVEGFGTLPKMERTHG